VHFQLAGAVDHRRNLEVQHRRLLLLARVRPQALEEVEVSRESIRVGRA